MRKADYQAYVAQAAALGRSELEEKVAAWRRSYSPDTFLGMYAAPSAVVVQAQLEAFLYRATGLREHAEQARRHLLGVGDYRAIVPPEVIARHPEYAAGIPALEACFQLPFYIHGYLAIQGSGVLGEADEDAIAETIRGSIACTLHFPEWGAHNRSMLRVWALALAVRALAGREGEGWRRTLNGWAHMRDVLAEESWGGWSIEDAQSYLPFWLVSCIEYSVHTGREPAYFRMPQTKYYFDFVAGLATGYGQIPDFGDANFNTNWHIWLACLEKGAAVYKCGLMKDAAARIAAFGLADQPVSPGIAAYLALACDWADDTVPPERPQGGSGELLEDLVGKKIVFRGGGEGDGESESAGGREDETYLLYNYRDEGDYALVARDNLRTTLPVPAEKMHHGHSDENAVLFLAAKRTILLHDGGYREQVPNGKYRADLYHNRLVFRDGERAAPLRAGAVYDALHDDGRYRRVRTEKLHFRRFAPLDYARTRLYDEGRKLVWDRMIAYLKQAGVFLVVDTVLAQADGHMTTANVWHTGLAEAVGAGGFATRVPFVHRGIGCRNPYVNADELALLVEFPLAAGRVIGSERIRRNYGEGVMLYEAETKRFQPGDRSTFVTVLTPYARSKPAEGHVGRVIVTHAPAAGDALALRYDGADGASPLHLAYKLDLGIGIGAPIFAGGPQFTRESGTIVYGDGGGDSGGGNGGDGIMTDADFAYAAEDGAYGFVNGSGLTFRGRERFAAPLRSTFRFGANDFVPTVSKWRAWEEGAASQHEQD
ncbi:MAG: hypothetical protein J7639_03060 [Paenibacillaceae bacterium]|nr:hypothetical protein [Paenibacillaceae bacterium]